MGAKKFGMSFETQGNQTFGGMSRDFWQDIPGVTEKFEKKSSCSIFGPYTPKNSWNHFLYDMPNGHRKNIAGDKFDISSTHAEVIQKLRTQKHKIQEACVWPLGPMFRLATEETQRRGAWGRENLHTKTPLY